MDDALNEELGDDSISAARVAPLFKAQKHMHTYTHTYTYTYIHTCIKKYAYSTYTCIYEGIYLNIDKYKYIDTYIHDYVHA